MSEFSGYVPVYSKYHGSVNVYLPLRIKVSSNIILILINVNGVKSVTL